MSKIASKCGKKGGKAKGYKYAQQRQQARKLAKQGKKAKDIAQITGLSIRAVYNAISEEKPTKKTVQKPTKKRIKYHEFNPLFCANSYQCSMLLVKDLRSNSHFVCERSELQSLNLLFLKQNTQTILLANRNFYFCFSPPQITHDLI